MCLHNSTGTFNSELTTGRFDLVFMTGHLESRNRFYITAGVDALMETVADSGETYSNYAGAFNVGAGLGLAGGKLDLRFSYMVPFGSDNADGITLVTAGAGF